MQTTNFTPFLNNNTPQTAFPPPVESKKRAYEPQFPDLHSVSKRLRFTIIIKKPLELAPGTGSTPLHFALQEGQYDDAIALIKRHNRLNVAETKTGWTPLHCLFCVTWGKERFFNLLELLLNGGCLPNTRSACGKTFLDNLSYRWDLTFEDYDAIFRILSKKSYVFYDREKGLPPFLLETAETRAWKISERASIISSYFSFIPREFKQQAASDLCIAILRSAEFNDGEMAQLIELVLNNLGHDFDPALTRDEDLGNLCYQVLRNAYLSPAEAANIIHILHQRGVDVEQSRPESSLFECLMAFNHSFHFKKNMIQELHKYNLKMCVTLNPEGEILPPNIAVIRFLISLKLSREEISEIMLIGTGEDWYREFLLLKLFSNCISTEIDWKNNDASVSLAGAWGNFTHFYQWLEKESGEFYESLSLSVKSSQDLLNKIDSNLSEEAAEAAHAIDKKTWHDILNTTGELLSQAFTQKRNPLSLSSNLNARGIHVVMPSFSTDDKKTNHMVGILFKPPVVLFCNKGDDLTGRSGISSHVAAGTKIETIFQDAIGKTSLYPFIRSHFQERIEEETGESAPFIVDQKAQLSPNCPVASYASLEMAILVTLVTDALPETEKESVIGIARAIKRAHRHARRKKIVEEYQQFHSEKETTLQSFLPEMKKILKGYLDDPIENENGTDSEIFLLSTSPGLMHEEMY